MGVSLALPASPLLCRSAGGVLADPMRRSGFPPSPLPVFPVTRTPMEWLANLGVKWVLVTVGVLALTRAILVRLTRPEPVVAAAREFLEASLIALVVVFLLIRPFLLQAYFIPSESMLPTLKEGDRLLVNKLVYRLHPPRRLDVMVFRPPEERVPEPREYIKRLIGLPGETVEVVPERLLVDGHVLMRLTHRSASEIMEENYASKVPVGFTFPLRGGSASLKDGEVTLRSGLDTVVKVVPYRPGDRIEERTDTVYLNKREVVSVIFGRLERSEDLRQWGGESGLVGRVYSTNGDPRLILVRGKKLALDPGHILVNGQRLEEPYVADYPDYAMAPLKIPRGYYFMMGDNRNHSLDSHAWGPLDRHRIIGRADVIFWPLSRFHTLGGM